MNESTTRPDNPIAPLLLLGSAVALFAATGALLPAGGHVLRLLLGGTSTSWLAYLAAILVGLAIAGRLATGSGGGRRSIVARLVLAECLAAAALSITPLLLHLARAVYLSLWPRLGSGWLMESLLRFVAASIVALPAGVTLGLVLHRLAEVARGEDPQEGASSGFTLGLAAGATALGMISGGILVQPALGARGGFLVAIALAGLGAAAGVLALRLAPGDGGLDQATTTPGATATIDAAAWTGWARFAGLLLSGAGLAGAVVAWHRVAGLLAGPTEATSLAVLVVTLLGLAIGGFVASGVARQPIPWPGALLTALAGGAVYLSMRQVPAAALIVLGYAPQALGRPVLLSLLAAGMLCLPASLMLGWALTSSPGRGSGTPATTPSPVGWPAPVALGALLGAGSAVLIVVPLFGLRRTLAYAAAALLASAALAVLTLPAGVRLVEMLGALTLLVAAAGAALTPAPWDPRVVAGGIYRYGVTAPDRFGSTDQWLAARLRGEGPRYYREGIESTVEVERSVQTTPGLPPIDTYTQTLDGRAVAGTGTDLRTQVLTGAIPPLLHPAAKKVLLVDLLTGVTAGSLLTHPIEELTVIEPEPAVVGSASLFGDFSNRPLDDARLHLVHDDARARLLADPTRYDLIVVALADPWRTEGAGVVTAEGFALAKRRLDEGGLFALRVALGGIPPWGLPVLMRTFASAFPSVLLFALTPDDLLLVGSEQPLRLDGARLRSVVGSNPAVADDLRRAVVVGANEVIMTLRLDRDALIKISGPGPLNLDDTMIVSAAATSHLEVQHHEGLMASIDAAWPGFDALLANYGATPEEKGTYLYGLAKSYLGISADPVRALDLARLLDAAGQPVRAHWVRGEALLQQRDLDGAVREWNAALAGDPNDIDALFSLGTFHLDGRDYQVAETYLARAARTHPDSAVVRYHYGRALFNLGRYERAIEELTRATAGEGGREAYPLSDYFIGLSASQLKHDEQAIASLKNYLTWAYKQNVLTRVEVDAHLKLSEVYERKGKRFDALQEKQKAERLRRSIEAYAAQHPAAAPDAGAAGAPSAGQEASAQGNPATPAPDPGAPPAAAPGGPAPNTTPSAPAPEHGG